MVRDFLDAPDLHQLTEACRQAVQARGSNIFPAVDAEHQAGVQFDAKMQPKSAANLGQQPLPPDLQRQVAQQDAKGSLERRLRRVHLKCRSTREVDRVYARLTRTRERYRALKQIPHYLTSEEERTGRLGRARVEEVQQQYGYEDVRRSFEAYRASGHMETEVRRDYHLNEAMEHLQNWSKCWCHLWPTSEGLNAVVRGDAGLGHRLGAAAAALSGEMVLRLYSDAAYESFPFMNATPFHCAGSALNVRSVHALTVMLGLADATGAGHARSHGLALLPGSHHLTRRLTGDGETPEALPTTGIFDLGHVLRRTAARPRRPVLLLPPLPPGGALFMHHYLLGAMLPTMEGAVGGAYVPPALRPPGNPCQYALSLIPDRCAFDGRRNSWISRDSHGPLYRYERGQLLTDEVVFPVLHRAIDVE